MLAEPPPYRAHRRLLTAARHVPGLDEDENDVQALLDRVSLTVTPSDSTIGELAEDYGALELRKRVDALRAQSQAVIDAGEAAFDRTSS